MDKPPAVHASNLRLDTNLKKYGNASLAFDVVPAGTNFVYSQLDHVFPQGADWRTFDVLHVSYHCATGLGISRFYVSLTSVDGRTVATVPAAIVPVAGEWQTLTIPLVDFRPLS